MALVIAPWNVPISLIVTPMVSSCIRRTLCDAEAVRTRNKRNYDRLVGLLNQTGGRIVYGGTNSRKDKYVPPAVFTDVTMQDKLHALSL